MKGSTAHVYTPHELVENNHDYAKVRYSLTTRGGEVYKTLSKTKRLNEIQKSLKNIREDKRALAEVKEFARIPSLAEVKEFARTRLLARPRSRHK